MSSPFGWQADDEPAAMSHHALGFDGPAVGLDEPAGYGKPQPVPPVLREREGSGTVEAIEAPWQVIGSDSRPGVGHLHLEGIGAGMGRHRYSAALGRVVDGVVQQIADRLGDADRVQIQLRESFNHFNARVTPPWLQPGPQDVYAGLPGWD